MPSKFAFYNLKYVVEAAIINAFKVYAKLQEIWLGNLSEYVCPKANSLLPWQYLSWCACSTVSFLSSYKFFYMW